VNVVNSQPPAPTVPFRQFYALAVPVSGLPTLMNSGGSVKGLSTVYIAP
jgi:hypothetical protein